MASPSTLGPTSTITVTHRTHRTLGTSLLTSFLKPFGSSLIKPPSKPIPAGSPDLHPPDAVFKDCNVHEYNIASLKCYDVVSRAASTVMFFTDGEGNGRGEAEAKSVWQRQRGGSPGNGTGEVKDSLSLDLVLSHEGHDIKSHDFGRTSTHSSRGGRGRKKLRRIYYFAGGGWRAPAAKEHWRLAEYLAINGTRTKKEEEREEYATIVTLVSYPLAPNCPAATTLPLLEKLYYSVLDPHASWKDHDEFDPPTEWSTTADNLRIPASPQDQEIWLAGDSAGGNVVLALILDVLRRNPKAPVPAGLLLISPAVDLRLSHSETASVAKKDPILTIPLSSENGRAWAGIEYKLDDPRVSPLLSTDFALLAKRKVLVHGVNGMYDIHAPDCVELVKRLNEAKVQGKWLEWDKQIHCFPLAWSYGLKEGKEAVKWIVEVLGPPK